MGERAFSVVPVPIIPVSAVYKPDVMRFPGVVRVLSKEKELRLGYMETISVYNTVHAHELACLRDNVQLEFAFDFYVGRDSDYILEHAVLTDLLSNIAGNANPVPDSNLYPSFNRGISVGHLGFHVSVRTGCLPRSFPGWQ